jgi:hypothetical protein
MSANDTARTIGDASDPRTEQTDLNGAGTAVGTRHPENRPNGQSLPVFDLPSRELDDYDDDKQPGDVIDELPPDQDVGESFPEIVDVGEQMAGGPRQAAGNRDVLDQAEEIGRQDENRLMPSIDNQPNQPRRFQNPRPNVGE